MYFAFAFRINFYYNLSFKKRLFCAISLFIASHFSIHHNAFVCHFQVETALALGATPRQETLQQVKRALVLDNAKTVGLLSLPGAMTGFIMGGASPLGAIQPQIVVMNMLVGASTVSTIISTYLCWPTFYTKVYQLETKVFSSD